MNEPDMPEWRKADLRQERIEIYWFVGIISVLVMLAIAYLVFSSLSPQELCP